MSPNWRNEAAEEKESWHTPWCFIHRGTVLTFSLKVYFTSLMKQMNKFILCFEAEKTSAKSSESYQSDKFLLRIHQNTCRYPVSFVVNV